MTTLIFSILTVLVGTGLIVGAAVTSSKKLSATVESGKGEHIGKINTILASLRESLASRESFCSQAQFDQVAGRVKALKDSLREEKEALVQLEKQLEEAQQLVEQKESQQQEVKTSREEDEQKLEEILAQFSDISQESIALEQKLALSMKNLDTMTAELQLTDDQRGVLEELAESLSRASENLRTLLLEYEGVNSRLNLLREQHDDLEEEYTKLVERQLGE